MQEPTGKNGVETPAQADDKLIFPCTEQTLVRVRDATAPRIRCALQAVEGAMNFLLYMIGRANQPAPVLRPTPRQMTFASVAGAACAGDFAGAARELEAGNFSRVIDVFSGAHLHL